VDALTPAERRGALVVVLLLVLGAAHDLWRAARPLPPPSIEPAGRVATARTDPPPEEATVPGDAAAGRAPGIDLNRATARELDDLPGVGPVLAGRILDHRRRHGPFRDPEELLAVRGIGPRLFARLRPRIRVGPVPPPGAAAPPDTAAPQR
jgi:competence protein ComEA